MFLKKFLFELSHLKMLILSTLLSWNHGKVLLSSFHLNNYIKVFIHRSTRKLEINLQSKDISIYSIVQVRTIFNSLKGVIMQQK